MGKRISLIAPNPPKLSELTDGLRAIESSGLFSNYGPVVRRFEANVNAQLFGGLGRSLTVANATLGLMIAMRHVADARGRAGGFALMPAFTFAATAHAAEWAGLTPLIADSDPDDWAMSPAAEEEALARFGDRIAVIVPYAVFGNGLDLERYQWLSERYGVGVVVDAAASMGTLNDDGTGFGAGAPFPVVFSMHATKPFATGEGGLIHSGDIDLIEALRCMTNFGFDGGRAAMSPAINAKLPEVLGLMAEAKLSGFELTMAHRANLTAAYRAQLGSQFTLQKLHGRRQAAQFMPLLLPPELIGERTRILAALDEAGIGAATYFSPHLGEQPHFQKSSVILATPIADEIGARMMSLPLNDHMALADVEQVCAAFRNACARPLARSSEPLRFDTLLVGGGPGGIAFLDSATKHDKLIALAQAGLAIVERGHSLGGGELPSYAITSDSTAETFLSAAKDNVHPELAALVDAGGGREIARWVGKLGVPLSHTGPFLQGLGEKIGAIVAANGGTVLKRHDVREAHRLYSGEWRVALTDLATGEARDAIAANIVLATGGYQSESDVAAATIAGATIGALAGDRLMLGDAALRLGGIDAIRERLADKPAPRIAIIGASTSALAAAALLLKANPGFGFGTGAVTLLHRQQLRPFYHSVEAAHTDGFTDFGPDDICPVSGFVYRLAGFRLEARELVLRTLGIGGRVPDPRLQAIQIGDDDAAVRRTLDQADVVIAALGYRPRALPLYDTAGKRIALAAHAPGRPRMVDQHCRVIDAEGRPVPGAYGIGLAAGFVPQGDKLGGEPSFKGKANGLWLWQNDVGQLIVDQLLEALARRAAA
jgi:dTDP-4-amino-4,6-dideoxygalactose transaminase